MDEEAERLAREAAEKAERDRLAREAAEVLRDYMVSQGVEVK